jgi:protein involved in polysaccharide export with SLBB domain
VNLDRYEEMSRDVVVRPDGAIRLPGIKTDLRIAGLTVGEADRSDRKEAKKALQNKPTGLSNALSSRGHLDS